MIKKLILAGGAVALLSSVTVGVPLWSYARCGVNYLRDSASDSVPVEWELKRARQMIADLKPEIEANAKRIAREKIDVARLEKQAHETDERLAKTQADIERLSADLRSGSNAYTYGGRTYTSAQVKDDLGNRFKRFKTRNETAKKLEQMLTARKASLRAAHERMDAMLSAKRQLEVEVENLQARLGALRVAQTSSQLNLDDSQLARTRELLDEIGARIDVEEEVMAVDVEYFGEIDLDEPAEETLLDDITAYFDGQDGNVASDSLVAIQLD
jgi:chromosome segregation ATPase